MFPLRIDSRLRPYEHEKIARALRNLPQFAGKTVSVHFLPELTAHRGKLLSGTRHVGTPVHAAAFIKRRRIVLESALLRKPGKLRLIFLHEIFHFVWATLGNKKREEYTAILRRERKLRARAELGESSTIRKERLHTNDCDDNSKEWRAYVCESFCDTGAWCYAGIRSNEFRLAKRWQRVRREWMLATFG